MSPITSSRVQLALNVSNLAEAIEFYSKYFNTPPAKVRPGYANFAIAEPPLKLVLMETSHGAGTINHLGVEYPTSDAVVSEVGRLTADGLIAGAVENTTCCFAVQDKAWIEGPDGIAWESYTVLADALVMHPGNAETVCCVLPANVEPSTTVAKACC